MKDNRMGKNTIGFFSLSRFSYKHVLVENKLGASRLFPLYFENKARPGSASKTLQPLAFEETSLHSLKQSMLQVVHEQVREWLSRKHCTA